MFISVFTPTHKTTYLMELYESMKNQNFHEWVIVLNNGAQPIDFGDNRVKYFEHDSCYVGALKRFACSKCTGDVYMEVDHDDLLCENAISEVNAVFESDPSVGFVYSNDAVFSGDFVDNVRFNMSMGWQYRDFIFKDRLLSECITFEPHPSSVAKIWFAPDHVRCWRSDVYWQTGGHNPEMRVLDDLDLMCRTFIVTKFKHIDKCLYLYRVTGENTWLIHNQEIQDNVMPIYQKYIQQMSLKWSQDNNTLALDLGGRFDRKEGFTSVDLKDADCITDLNDTWPWADNSVGVIVANDILEHLKDPLHVMKEAHRVLVHGGMFLVEVPSTDGRGAYQDPTHISFWNQNSFWYYTRAQQAKYIDTPVRFQSCCLETHFPSDWWKENNISYVRSHMIALKDGVRIAGPVEI